MEVPSKGYFRLFPGNKVRLKYGYIVKCLGMKDGEAKIEKFLSDQQKIINGWKVGSFFGNREFFNGNWLLRAAGASKVCVWTVARGI